MIQDHDGAETQAVCLRRKMSQVKFCFFLINSLNLLLHVWISANHYKYLFSFLISTEEGDYYEGENEGENEDVDYENDEAENLGKDEVKPIQMSDDQGKVGVEKVQKCGEPQNKTGQDEKEQIKDIGDSFKNANEEKQKENDEANPQGQKENKNQETK